jgi:thiol-disulfide isomerase/thioredoxin
MASIKTIAGAILIAAAAAHAQTDEIAWLNDYEAALAQAKEENKPVLVDFYADWCGPCKMMDAQTFPDPRVIRETASFVAVKVDVDRNERVAYAYRIESIPRTVVLNVHGQVVGDRIGFLDADAYVAFLNDVREFTHTKREGDAISVPASRAESLAISESTGDDELIGWLGDPDPAVRKRARDELLRREPIEIERILNRAANHEYLGVRLAAFEILHGQSASADPGFDPWKRSPATPAPQETTTQPQR